MPDYFGQTVDFIGLVGETLESPLALVDPAGMVTVGSAECPTLGENCLKIVASNQSDVAYIVDSMQIVNGKSKFSLRIGYHSGYFATPDPWGDAWTIAVAIFHVLFQGGIGAMTVLDGLCRAYQNEGHNPRAFEPEDIADPVARVIPCVNSTNFSLCMKFERAGLCRMSVYEAGTGVQIGAEKTWAAPDALGAYFELGLFSFRYGPMVPVPQTLFFNGLVFDYTNANYPILDHYGTATVTFDSDGGSSVSPVTVGSGDPIGPLPIPTKDGYAFIGWYESIGGMGTKIAADTVINTNMTAYARWSRPIIVWEDYMSEGVNGANRGLNGAVWQTPEGGIAVRLINKTGGVSVKGTVVSLDGTNPFGVVATPVDATTNIGVIAEDGIADGYEVWVTVAGKALVAFHDNVGVMGNYVRAPIAGDAALAVKEKYTFKATHAATAAGNVTVKIPSLAAVTVAMAGTETVDQVAAAIAAATFTGWTHTALTDTVTFEQVTAATTDGIASFTDTGATGVTETVTRTAIGKPAITPTAGVAVASGTISAAGRGLGILLEDHTARRYADDLALAMVVLKSN